MAEDPRLAAVRALDGVLAGGQAFAVDAIDLPDPRDEALARALGFGVLRWLPLLEARLDGYLRRPLKPRDRELRWLLLCGLYQLGWMRLPAHAALHATVEVCRALDKGWATGLVNGVLRAFQRDGAPTEAPAGAEPSIQAAHPPWLYRALAEAWPDQLDAVLAANNAPGPMWLRVRSDREAALRRLAEAGHPGRRGRFAATALRLERPASVESLPGFADGDLSVQDQAAQLAAELLEAQPGQRVLDACAAPGGKAGHLLERVPGLSLTALELDSDRATRIGDNLARLGLEAEVRVADATRPEAWWDGRPFDRILIDAPCSGSGVIRRHPDIKALRTAGDLDALAATQKSLLEALWPLLATDGILLYATCSVLPAENDGVIEAFLQAHPEARANGPVADWGIATAHGRQILPGEDDMDGFFYARLVHS